MAPRGDDFQLWFSPCSLAMCGGRALEQNTNQPKCKMALLMNLVLSNGLLTFNSYPRFSPVEKHHLITPTPLENVEPPNHPHTNAKQGKQHDAIQLRSTSLVALHYTTTPEQEPGQLNEVLKCGFARVS